MAQLAQETISTAHRLAIASKLQGLKMEIEALTRLLQDCNKQVRYTDLESLINRHNDLLHMALNEGLLDTAITPIQLGKRT